MDSNFFVSGLETPLAEEGRAVQFLHRLREDGGIPVASVAVLEEVFHSIWRLTRDRHIALARSAATSEALALLYPVTRDDHARAMSLAREVALPDYSARDYYHAAVMLNRGIRHVVSSDRDFDRFPGIIRLDPRTANLKPNA